MTSNEVLGRAAALDQYVVSVDELAMLAVAVTFRPRYDDEISGLGLRLWLDLIAIDPTRARESWEQIRDNKKSDTLWLLALMEHLPKKEIKSL